MVKSGFNWELYKILKLMRWQEQYWGTLASLLSLVWKIFCSPSCYSKRKTTLAEIQTRVANPDPVFFQEGWIQILMRHKMNT